MDNCGGLGDVVAIIKSVYNILQILIPIALVLFGLIDLGKAVIAGKEDEMKKAQGTLIKRVIYAVAVFLVFSLVSFAIGLVGSGENADTTSWLNCWNNTSASNSTNTQNNQNGN